ncbi:DNA glycosylase AlkZ-like family protein [Saccharothrix australiensis]|uniref:Winged helix DNA-binding protein n=1 Tax=Saccharothrix australiensis TaxID=2072 RepID=A0A495VTG2_9PSEU|nr:crosslink repair DNA glycosylase YcaQ family protein [Saccharothrix australiensis]RKT52629.1 winged helix DNA-binding protein [Saccharothrix australiensis]
MTDRERVIAYRVAAHQFDRTATGPSALRVFDLGVQDSERSALPALAARLETPDLADSVLTWSVRGAPHWHRPGALPGLAAALWPLSDADAVTRMNRPPVTAGLAVLRQVVEALRAVVDRPMTKGEASAAITPLVPPEVTGWCRRCAATHVHDPVFRLAVLPAGLRFDPTARTVTFVPVAGSRTPDRTTGFAGLVADYLRLHGPAGPSEVADFVGAPVREVKAAWPDDLVEVAPRAWLPADRATAFENPPRPDVARLLPPLDPYLSARDRALLVPDEGRRKEVWRVLGRPGAIMVDGEVLGTWRARATGNRLDITLSPFAPLDLDRFEDEATRLATARGLDRARLT